jgi:hypothetical protein
VFFKSKDLPADQPKMDFLETQVGFYRQMFFPKLFQIINFLQEVLAL